MPLKRGPKPGASRITFLPSSYPGRPDGRGLEFSQWEACRAILEGVLVAKTGARYIGDIFRSLPDREAFPDYYQTIPEPESLEHIANVLGSQGYPTPEAFFNQLQLVFLNAKHYNEGGSQIWGDADQLETQIKHAWKSNTNAGVFGSGAGAGPASTRASLPALSPISLSPVAPFAQSPAQPAVPFKRPRGRPPKDRSMQGATPANESPQTIRLNFRQPSTPLATGSIGYPSTPHVPSPLPNYSLPVPTTPGAGASPSSSALPPATPVSLGQAVESNQPGVNQFTTPAALVPPVSPDHSEKIQRQRLAEADQQWIDALESRLPHWQGPQQVLPGETAQGGVPGSGWFGEGAPEYERQFGGPSSYPGRIRAVLHAITEYRDTSGTRLSDALAQVSAAWDRPYLSSHSPISLDTIRQSQYNSLGQFDRDMTRLFERCRRYHPDGSTEYGRVLVLQRLYNALTAPYPMALPPNGIPNPNPTLFASLPAGPGTARPLHEITQDLKAGVAETEVGFGITTFRVGTKDRIFTDEARHKGMAYKTGDYVHLINPDDASRPIIGQVFKTFVPTKGYRTHHLTVCWYYRPEQIVHTASRLFFEGEIFKTSHFCDHPVEDIIERVSCQFYVKAIRGRPQAPEYYPGWPIYICHSRYNDRGWFTVRIKNWASCIPDELRQTGFMDIISFDRQIEPQLVKSPFLRGIRGPGFFAEAREGGDDDDEDEGQAKRRPNPEPTRRPGRPPGSGVATPPSYAPVTASQQRYPQSTPQTYQPQQYRQPPPQVQTPTQVPAQQRPTSQPLVNVPLHARTIAGMMGGPQAVDQHAFREYLAPDVARLFERDSRNQVLWFSGPPLAPGQIKVPTQPKHSLEYLEYLVQKKNGQSPVPLDGEPRGKRYRQDRDPVQQEPADDVEMEEESAWWAQGLSEDQYLAALLAVVENA